MKGTFQELEVMQSLNYCWRMKSEVPVWVGWSCSCQEGGVVKRLVLRLMGSEHLVRAPNTFTPLHTHTSFHISPDFKVIPRAK